MNEIEWFNLRRDDGEELRLCEDEPRCMKDAVRMRSV